MRGLGVTDYRHPGLGLPVVRLAYCDSTGRETATRYRVCLDKPPKESGLPDRFKWKAGAKVTLYGRERLALARERGYVTLTEGESDVHTLTLHGEPCAGLPGADIGSGNGRATWTPSRRCSSWWSPKKAARRWPGRPAGWRPRRRRTCWSASGW